MKTWSLVFWETEQNEVSLWLKKEQISVNVKQKLVSTLNQVDFSEPIGTYLFLF